MKIIEGSIPTDHTWRVVLLLSPNARLDLLWAFAVSLAEANLGSVLAVVLVDSQMPETVAVARALLSSCRKTVSSTLRVETLLARIDNPSDDIAALLRQTDADLLLIHADNPLFRNVVRPRCAVGVMRGHGVHGEQVEHTLDRVLVPTSGGPATAHALRFLKNLSPAATVDALYVARLAQGQHEMALGRERLRQVLNAADAHEQLRSRAIQAASVTEGIVEEAIDYDLVIVGATHESSVDRIVFGNVVEAVVRESRTPVLVIREPAQRWRSFANWLEYSVQRLFVPLEKGTRAELYVRIRANASPDLDYFAFIGLSSAIAALGLILNSPAVVIGAMLVAPLMSPIIGTGLALVLGDLRFLRYALGSVLQGAALAIIIGLILGFLPQNTPLSAEVMARTAPSLLDLGVALFAGLAGAYAICDSDASGALPGVAIAAALVPPLSSVGLSWAAGEWQAGFGALLLFTTNLVTIGSAGAVVFLLNGFRPSPGEKQRRRAQVQAAQLALTALVLVALTLGVTTYLLAQQSSRRAQIEELTQHHVALVLGDVMEQEFEVAGNVNDRDASLTIDVTAWVESEPTAAQAEAIQAEILRELETQFGFDGDVALNLTYIHVKRLAPQAVPASPAAP